MAVTGTIMVTENEILARVLQAQLTAGPPIGIEEIYHFSHDFQLKKVSFSDQPSVAHRQLELQGLLQHSFEQCPERTAPRPVRVWEPSTGWRELPRP